MHEAEQAADIAVIALPGDAEGSAQRALPAAAAALQIRPGDGIHPAIERSQPGIGIGELLAPIGGGQAGEDLVLRDKLRLHRLQVVDREHVGVDHVGLRVMQRPQLQGGVAPDQNQQRQHDGERREDPAADREAEPSRHVRNQSRRCRPD